MIQNDHSYIWTRARNAVIYGMPSAAPNSKSRASPRRPTFVSGTMTFSAKEPIVLEQKKTRSPGYKSKTNDEIE